MLAPGGVFPRDRLHCARVLRTGGVGGQSSDRVENAHLSCTAENSSGQIVAPMVYSKVNRDLVTTATGTPESVAPVLLAS